MLILTEDWVSGRYDEKINHRAFRTCKLLILNDTTLKGYIIDLLLFNGIYSMKYYVRGIAHYIKLSFET